MRECTIWIMVREFLNYIDILQTSFKHLCLICIANIFIYVYVYTLHYQSLKPTHQS